MESLEEYSYLRQSRESPEQLRHVGLSPRRSGAAFRAPTCGSAALWPREDTPPVGRQRALLKQHGPRAAPGKDPPEPAPWSIAEEHMWESFPG